MVWWNELTELQKIFASIAIPATLFLVIQFILLLFGFTQGEGADMADGADIDGGDLDSAGFDGLDLDGAGFDGAGFDGADLDGAGFDGVDLDGGDFDNTGMDGIHVDAPGFDGVGAATADGATGHGIGDSHDTADALRLFSVKSIIAFLSVGGWMGIVAIDWKLSSIVAIALALAAGWIALYFVAWTIRAFVRMQQSGNVRIENAVGKEGDVYLSIPVDGHGKVSVIVQDRLCEMDAISNAGRLIKTGEKVLVLGVASEGILLVAPKNYPEKAIAEAQSEKQ